MYRYILLFFIGFLLSHIVIAQKTNQYRIKAGKLFDSEAGVFKTNMVILVKGQAIEDVKEEKNLTDAEKNYTLIDLSINTFSLIKTSLSTLCGDTIAIIIPTINIII